MEEIRKMKKTSFMKLIKQRINLKTFKNLQQLKKSHSKVEHSGMKMQKYLQPNRTKMTKDLNLRFKRKV
jgi:hypothetical protein